MKHRKLTAILASSLIYSSLTLGACSGAKVEDETDHPSADAGADTSADAAADAGVDAEASSAAVVINEVTSDGDDTIELYNVGDERADLSGWYIVDDAYDIDTGEPADHRYEFDDGEELAAGAYLVLTKDVEHTFGVGKDDALRLFDADDKLVDSADWPDQAAETSWCRIPNGTGDFEECAAPSFGGPNGL